LTTMHEEERKFREVPQRGWCRWQKARAAQMEILRRVGQERKRSTKSILYLRDENRIRLENIATLLWNKRRRKKDDGERMNFLCNR